MVGVDLNAISDLLDQALDLDAHAREPWLTGLARTEPDLAAKLRELLSRQGELETGQLLMGDGRLLNANVLADAIEKHATAPQFVLQPGTHIGPYRLLRPLGEGGMASVWLAERNDGQLKREVALKLLHAWRNSRELVERFARERDMLAGLTHPNIARLYDAGVTAVGQPWIALEYVEGLDFASFADQNVLSVRQRVESILQVMAAVQYAHQNLIVHRDLKPTNILVNQKGEVRLLDFGIAKLLQQENVSAAETELTRNSGRALTLRYAAPEQIEGNPITTATDVYALGLVLYELLTGSSARGGDKAGLGKTGAVAEQAALSTDILRPSRGPFTEAAALARGNVSPKELKSTLSGDLDTILLKALAREPARRYPTVGAFAADLSAWLERRPITARTPSLAYEARMFVSRQRVAIGFASAIMAVLVGAGIYSWMQRVEAEAQRARSEEVQIFMANILSEAEPEGVKGEVALTAKGLLDAGVLRAREDYAEKPLMRGEMLAELARVYLRINEIETGDSLLREAIGLIEKNAPPDEPSLHVARSHLGGLLVNRGARAQAVAMLTSVLTGCTRATVTCLGAKGNAYAYLADEPGIPLTQRRTNIRQAQELFAQSFGPRSSNMSLALISGADIERLLGNLPAATEQLARVDAKFSSRRTGMQEHYFLGRVKLNLAFAKGEYAQARALIDQLLVELPANRNADRLYLQVFAANIANYQGLSAVALAEVAEARVTAGAAEAPLNLAYAVFHEARALALQGQYALAEKSAWEFVDILRRAAIEEGSPFWLDGIRLQAEIDARRGNLKSGRDLLEKALESLRANHPDLYTNRAHVLDTLGAVSLAMGDADFAKTCHDEEQALLSTRLPTDHPLRLRADLQSARAQALISSNAFQQRKIAEIAAKISRSLPDKSAHLPVLQELSSNASNKQQLLLLF